MPCLSAHTRSGRNGRVFAGDRFFLPGYAPDLNQDELLNGDIKRVTGQTRPRDREALKAATRKWLHRRQKQPHVLVKFFDAPHVRYAAEAKC
jgi:hypothetical protein